MTKRFLLAFAFLGVALTGCASAGQSFPEFTAPVVDATAAVSSDIKAQVSNELLAFQQAGGPQVAVAVVNSTGNESLENYSIDLARTWGVGNADTDNGVLIVIALDDRKLRIEVGSGVEGELTDVTAGSIVDGVMHPRLRANDVNGAVRDGARAVMQVWRGDGIPMVPTGPVATTVEAPSTLESIFSIILFFGVILTFVVLAALGRLRGGGVLGPFAAGTLYGGGFAGHRGGFGGGGFGGGGFGGFGGGGGGFSGGGAGGSW